VGNISLVQAQADFRDTYKYYAQKLREKVLSIIRNEKALRGQKEDNLKIIVVPYYHYKKTYASEIFIPDTSFNSVTYSLYYFDSQIFCIPKSRIGENYSFTDIAYVDSTGFNNNKQIGIVQSTLRKSNNLFYVRILDRENFANLPLGFLVKDKIKYVDFDFNFYNSIEEFITTKYGSDEKYNELKAEDSTRYAIFKKMGIEDCKNVFRNDYSYSHNKDSGKIIDLYVKEVDSFADLRYSQKIFLKQKIRNYISRWGKTDNCINEFSLFGCDMTVPLETVLTDDQLKKYRGKLRLKKWLQARAMDKLNYYYLNERKIPVEQLKKVFNEEVF
jgi:hypothetical protein